LSDCSQIIFFVNPEAAGRISPEPKKVEIPRIAAVMGRPDLSSAGVGRRDPALAVRGFDRTGNTRLALPRSPSSTRRRTVSGREGSAGADRSGSETASGLQHIRLDCGECSRFIADPLLWKCVEMWISVAKLQHDNKGGGFGPAPQIKEAAN
jgi:hypothetical protein